MKRENKKSMFSCIPDADKLEPSLARHLGSRFCRQVKIDERFKTFTYTVNGMPQVYKGLINTLKYKYYPHYKQSVKKRDYRTKTRGSTRGQGKHTDARVAEAVRSGGKLKGKVDAYTKALLDYWRDHGHVLQAAQVPAVIKEWNCATAADCLTLDTATNTLWMWEIKTGMPVGFFKKQGVFAGPLSRVECTGLNIWHLQRHFTKLALVNAGVCVAGSAVIQVHKVKGRADLVVKVHEPPGWTNQIGPIRDLQTLHYRPLSARQKRKRVEKETKEFKLPRLSGRKPHEHGLTYSRLSATY